MNLKLIMEENDQIKLYSDEDKHILKIAEDSLDSKLDRVEEIIEYAREAGLKKIGIANCTVFNKEAQLLSEILSENGFTVETVNCKYGKIPFTDLVDGYKGISCNPAGQANYLEEKGTELNIMMGLCLGHDMIFNSKSKAPVTPLVVKDRVLQHYSLDKLRKS
ncbi:MAG: DUF1847 domain-containing protein [Bacteroidales bacterium]|nr:DUF1847 domain-containing protein [Bacteroidales bacterium]